MSADLTGKRVELVSCSDQYTRLKPGSQGTITGYRMTPAMGSMPPMGQLSVRWDDGSTLMLLDGEDHWKVLA